MHIVAAAPLPEEITRGDWVVSAHSAQLPGVARTTAIANHHEAFRYDPEIMRRFWRRSYGRLFGPASAPTCVPTRNVSWQRLQTAATRFSPATLPS